MPNLAGSRGFLLSRSLKWRFKLKDKICIAHKSEAAVIARSKIRLGVDAERILRRDFDAIMEFCFDERERKFVQNAHDKILVFYKIWTAKEAYIKFKKLGFSSLKSVNFYEILHKMTINFIRIDDFLIALIYKKTVRGEVYLWRA